MEVSRRSFLQICSFVGATALLPNSTAVEALAESFPEEPEIIDTGLGNVIAIINNNKFHIGNLTTFETIAIGRPYGYASVLINNLNALNKLMDFNKLIVIMNDKYHLTCNIIGWDDFDFNHDENPSIIFHIVNGAIGSGPTS